MIKIYTFAHKRPDFIGLQLQSFKKNLEDEFEFIVYNNAKFDTDQSYYNQIHLECKVLNLKCVDVQHDLELENYLFNLNSIKICNHVGEYTDPCIACAYPLCWAWKHHLGIENEKIVIIDSDMFFIEQFSFSQLFDNYDIAYVPQSRGKDIRYMWNGLVFANVSNIPEPLKLNWWCGLVKSVPVDVGGQTHHYLEEYGNSLRQNEIGVEHIDDDTAKFQPSNYEYLKVDSIRKVLHYRGGSNWNLMSGQYHNEKTKWLRQLLK